MPPSVVLHIGIHKTGSTSIQVACHTMAERLRPFGLLYPSAARGVHGEEVYGHHALSWAIRRARRGEAAPNPSPWDALTDEVARTTPRRVVLSSEDFESYDADGVAAVRARLEGAVGGAVRVIVYLRNPLAVLRSAYKQRLRMGTATARFPAFVEARLHRVDYVALVRRWSGVFGADALRVCSFDAAIASPSGLVGDFMDRVVEDLTEPPPYAEWLGGVPDQKNLSIPDDAAQALRHVNRFARRLQRLGLSPSRARGVRLLLRKGVLRAYPGPLRPVVRAAGPLATTAEMDTVRALLHTIDYAPLATWSSPEDRAFLAVPSAS